MTAPGRHGRAVRLTANPEEVGRGLGQVVVVLLELLRDLLERQAVRRMDSDTLPPAQVEDLGQALIEVREAIAQVRDSLGVSAEQARAATARARELVGEWPPSGGRDEPRRTGAAARVIRDGVGRTGLERPRGAGGGRPRGDRVREGVGAENHGAERRETEDHRTDDHGIPAVGATSAAGRRHHERGRPAPRARGAAPPGWDLP
ncbi:MULTISPECIES: gas vesicle protein GvpK [unclassified Pseudofrankia]|uniref:gas vesicle protein GvpK n=1 Tax=unclassified Pseudofrankia TaxID=2994372 RepID=UPI0008D99FE5|nr:MULTISPECIES: gas vesicle protein GvpK [unclassified Pseudofrankia]MDT3446374.1 gas vesicle protein GvpK [Pseudofrankia sp. BMG5.37]OHV59307.1 hypothetical protein BCD48_41440 [Pseudofrankia sp. BMG5.36]